jgi:hypothetical protein
MAEMYAHELNKLVERVERDGSVQDAIECLTVHDVHRKRLDRIQADPPRYRTRRQT